MLQNDPIEHVTPLTAATAVKTPVKINNKKSCYDALKKNAHFLLSIIIISIIKLSIKSISYLLNRFIEIFDKLIDCIFTNN